MTANDCLRSALNAIVSYQSDDINGILSEHFKKIKFDETLPWEPLFQIIKSFFDSHDSFIDCVSTIRNLITFMRNMHEPLGQCTPGCSLTSAFATILEDQIHKFTTTLSLSEIYWANAVDVPMPNYEIKSLPRRAYKLIAFHVNVLSSVFSELEFQRDGPSERASVILKNHDVPLSIITMLLSTRTAKKEEHMNDISVQRSYGVFSASLALFSACSDPSVASQCSTLFCSLTGLNQDDLVALLHTPISTQLRTISCFKDVEFGNRDASFVGCARGLWDHHITRTPSPDITQTTFLFDLGLLFSCALISVQPKNMNLCRPSIDVIDENPVIGIITESTPALTVTLSNELSLLLSFSFWSHYATDTTTDITLQIESAAMLSTHPIAAPLLLNLTNNLPRLTSRGWRDNGSFKPITSHMVTSLLCGFFRAGTDIPLDICCDVEHVLYFIFYGPYVTHAEQDYEPANTRMMPAVLTFLDELANGDEQQRRRAVVCLWALATCSDGEQFVDIDASTQFARLLAGGIDDALALFAIRFFSSLYACQRCPSSACSVQVFCLSIPPLTKYLQRVDSPLHAKYAWNAIQALIARLWLDGQKTSDDAALLVGHIVAALPATIELFVRSVNSDLEEAATTGKPEEYSQQIAMKQGVLLGILATTKKIASAFPQLDATLLLLSFLPLIPSFSPKLVRVHFVRLMWDYRTPKMQSALLNRSTHPLPLMQLAERSYSAEELVDMLSLSLLKPATFDEFEHDVFQPDLGKEIYGSLDVHTRVSIIMNSFRLFPAFCRKQESRLKEQGIVVDRTYAQRFLNNLDDFVERVNDVCQDAFTECMLALRVSLQAIHPLAVLAKTDDDFYSSWANVLVNEPIPTHLVKHLSLSPYPEVVSLMSLACSVVAVLENNPDTNFTIYEDRAQPRRIPFIDPIEVVPNHSSPHLIHRDVEWRICLLEQGMEDVIVHSRSHTSQRIWQWLGVNLVKPSRNQTRAQTRTQTEPTDDDDDDILIFDLF
ncbi:hypothetical protein BLNAU_6312 [Blattamonas nauphoetae]|uniref:Uncharacterized protein n=1 Tax=Blattamonas nauphoetae TaxID=2049346 RepID=A0ABQ9Y556_9EUKA|nr:hypothetical protein BLNAU_6312 [Blattamonas nauphoetae]